jgi:hypothetical protein
MLPRSLLVASVLAWVVLGCGNGGLVPDRPEGLAITGAHINARDDQLVLYMTLPENFDPGRLEVHVPDPADNDDVILDVVDYNPQSVTVSLPRSGPGSFGDVYLDTPARSIAPSNIVQLTDWRGGCLVDDPRSGRRPADILHAQDPGPVDAARPRSAEPGPRPQDAGGGVGHQVSGARGRDLDRPLRRDLLQLEFER